MEPTGNERKVQIKTENALESGVLTLAPRTDTFLHVSIVEMPPFSSKLGNRKSSSIAKIQVTK